MMKIFQKKTVKGRRMCLDLDRSRRGLGTEFRSEKILRNRLGMISVIPWKKVLIPKHSEFRGRANSEARNGTERNGIPRKNEVLGNSHRIASLITLTSNTISEILGCRVLC
jgi:hypothetical protein